MVDLITKEPTFCQFFFNKETKKLAAIMIWLTRHLLPYQRYQQQRPNTRLFQLEFDSGFNISNFTV